MSRPVRFSSDTKDNIERRGEYVEKNAATVGTLRMPTLFWETHPDVLKIQKAASRSSTFSSSRPAILNSHESERVLLESFHHRLSEDEIALFKKEEEEEEIEEAKQKSLLVAMEQAEIAEAKKKSLHVSDEEAELRTALFISQKNSDEDELKQQNLPFEEWVGNGWIRKSSAKEKLIYDEEYIGGSRRIGNMTLVSPDGEYVTKIMVCSVISIYENAVKQQGKKFMISRGFTNPWKLFARMCRLGWWRDLRRGEMPDSRHIRRMASIIGHAINVITEGEITENGKKCTDIRETAQVEGNGNPAFTIRLRGNHYWNSGDGKEYAYK